MNLAGLIDALAQSTLILAALPSARHADFLYRELIPLVVVPLGAEAIDSRLEFRFPRNGTRMKFLSYDGIGREVFAGYHADVIWFPRDPSQELYEAALTRAKFVVWSDWIPPVAKT